MGCGGRWGRVVAAKRRSPRPPSASGTASPLTVLRVVGRHVGRGEVDVEMSLEVGQLYLGLNLQTLAKAQ
eukprot:2668472-Rhodomonas_salina.3